MWHKVGALVITTDSKALRIAAQDWHHLTIHAWPSAAAAKTAKDLYFRDDSCISVALQSDGSGGVQVHGTGPANTTGTTNAAALEQRTWLLRLHLATHERLDGAATVEGAKIVSPPRHLNPSHDCAKDYFPFAGAGATPACKAGAIVEISIQASKAEWSVGVTISHDGLTNVK